MSPKELLQGNWLGHPLHPALVHLPAGLWPAATVFDLVSWVGDGSNAAARAAFACVAVGLIATLAAAPTGLADWWDIKPGKPARKLGWWHLALNVAVALLMLIGLWLRWRGGLAATRVPAAAVASCAVANAGLLAAGYLGGRMVFDHGVSVARQSKHKWRKIAEEGKARLPAE